MFSYIKNNDLEGLKKGLTTMPKDQFLKLTPYADNTMLIVAATIGSSEIT